MARTRKPAEDATKVEGEAAATTAAETPDELVEASQGDAEASPPEVQPEIIQAQPEAVSPRPEMGKFLPVVEAVRKENPRIFALVVKGAVREIITEIQNIEEEWHPDVLAQFVEITGDKNPPSPGWTHEKGKFAEPKPEEFSPTQKRQLAFNQGVNVIRAGTPQKMVFNRETWRRLGELAQHAALFQELPGGRAVEVAGMEFKSADELLATFKALSVWREGWNQFVDGKAEAPPEDVTV